MISAKIVLDSIAPYTGKRITSFLVVIPKIFNAQLNTHGRLAKNAESSRARSMAAVRQQVMEDPYIPSKWTSDCAGMVSNGVISDPDWARSEWLKARDNAVISARNLKALGCHKEIVNRVLEPWMWQRILVTATEWDNFFHLRLHRDAQHEMQLLAQAMKTAMDESTPVEREVHTPFSEEGDPWVSANRCKRISYGREEIRKSVEVEIEEAQKMLEMGHMSPFEHQAKAARFGSGSGPFCGWLQFRKTLPKEGDPLG